MSIHWSGSHSSKILLSLVSVLLFSVLLAGMYYLIQPAGTILDSGWKFEKDGVVKQVDLLDLQEERQYALHTYRVNFKEVDANILVIPRPSANAIQIVLNGQQIYAVGDLKQPSANLWNIWHIVPLADGLLQDDNYLEITISRNYTMGLKHAPFLARSQDVYWRFSMINWFSNELILIAMGAAIMIGILLILLSLTRKKHLNPEIFMGLAAIFSAIYCLDYIYIPSLVSPFLFFIVKKILLISAYLASLNFIIGIELYYHNRLTISKISAIPTLISVLILAVLPDMPSIFDVLSYLNILLLINLVIVILFIFRGESSNHLMIFTAILLALSLLQMTVVMVFHLSFPELMQYIVVLSSLILGTNFILEFNHIFKKNEELLQISNIDPLTNVFNRRIFQEIKPEAFSVAAVFDIDNFKYYNDDYGHAEGDNLLIGFAKICSSKIRQTDVVVRTGGDEFLLLLCDITSADAQRIIDRICSDFRNLCRDERVNLSYGIATTEDTLQNTIRTADIKMYQMKKERKEKFAS